MLETRLTSSVQAAYDSPDILCNVKPHHILLTERLVQKEPKAMRYFKIFGQPSTRDYLLCGFSQIGKGAG